MAATKLVGWGVSAPESKKAAGPQIQMGEAKVRVAEAAPREGRKQRRCQFSVTLGCIGAHAPWGCMAYGDLVPEEWERIINDNCTCYSAWSTGLTMIAAERGWTRGLQARSLGVSESTSGGWMRSWLREGRGEHGGVWGVGWGWGGLQWSDYMCERRGWGWYRGDTIRLLVWDGGWGGEKYILLTWCSWKRSIRKPRKESSGACHTNKSHEHEGRGKGKKEERRLGQESGFRNALWMMRSTFSAGKRMIGRKTKMEDWTKSESIVEVERVYIARLGIWSRKKTRKRCEWCKAVLFLQRCRQRTQKESTWHII